MKRSEAIQWTPTLIAREFGMDSRTVGKRLASADLNDKKTLNTQEVCRAMFGDIDSEKLRLVREQADKFALDNAASRHELISAKEMQTAVEKCFGALVATVQAASNLENEDRAKLIANLKQTVANLAASCGSVTDATVLHREPVERDVPLP
jgi:hypothetical protein